MGRSGDVPIADYGLLGDTRTAALVSPSGSIDWCCLPRFDGLPVFSRLVGGDEGGRFGVSPADPFAVVDRRYRPGSTVLETTWRTNGSELTLAESMVAEVSGRLLPTTLLVRRVSCRGRPAPVAICFEPRLGGDWRPPRIERRREALVCSWGDLALGLEAAPEIELSKGESAVVDVEPGRPLTLALSVAHRQPLVFVDPEVAWAEVAADDRRWRAWSAGIEEDVPFSDAVVRSLVTLRLLTYSPSGAPVAAPTTSLPEKLGGVRNWDYRFAWPRDASIGIGAFLGVGKVEVARAFMRWLLHASRLERPRMPVLLTLDGKPGPPEDELDHWPGYAASRPVRLGNGAAGQHQLDGYGWVVDAAWLLTDAGHRLYDETWRAISAFADEVTRRWRDPDAGIWELRDDQAHHTHSKLMAWLALDRALRIAVVHRTSSRRVRRWREERDALARDVFQRGFDSSRGAYTGAYGSTDLDAALLLLPVLEFEPPGSPRVAGTIAAIRRELSAGGPLLYRYPPGRDGLPGGEGAFLPCSFWLVQALARTGAADEATAIMADLLARAGLLGLLAEEMDPNTGAHLGNYPQALTHAALVQAALALRGARTDPSARQVHVD